MMNEQIRELAKDADIDWHRYWNDDGSNRLQIFAELIVRECAEIVQEGRWMVPPSQHQLARSIKQHFGVEE